MGGPKASFLKHLAIGEESARPPLGNERDTLDYEGVFRMPLQGIYLRVPYPGLRSAIRTLPWASLGSALWAEGYSGLRGLIGEDIDEHLKDAVLDGQAIRGTLGTEID